MIFTVITSTFNSEKTLERTIESVLNQTFIYFEYIVIDGASTDATVKILESYESKFMDRKIGYKWISEKDSGIYDAWNKGLNLAQGQWISFLGSDDYYLPNALEIYYNLIKSNSGYYDWIYSNVIYSDTDDKNRILDAEWTWKRFRRNTTITPAHVGSFHNIEYFKKFGKYDTSYKIAGDYELLLRARENLKTLKVNETTAVMSGGGVSNSMIKEALKETLRAKHNIGRVGLFTCYYDYFTLLFKLKIKKQFKK